MDPDLAIALLAEIQLQCELLESVVMPSATVAQLFRSLGEQRALILETLPSGLATREQNRAGVAACFAALRAAGDPDPQMTLQFVGRDTAMEYAQATISGPDEVHEAFFEQPPGYVVDMAKALHPAYRHD